VDPGAEIRNPALTEQLDYEVELVVVMGAPVTPLSEDGVPAVLGYTVGNDVSARDQRNELGPDLVSMKSLDATTPIGPWITTLDELGAPAGLDVTIRCRVNGEIRQEDTTLHMLWQVPEILEFFRTRISLAPGDVIFTGTTCGVGLEDGRFLTGGDVLESEVEGVGVLRNTVGDRGARG
jgi:2-keto-4-pentenoate hydratase/2-oxohepta-3-ene-1,7-dioic acid hydratase in catechol pathway